MKKTLVILAAGIGNRYGGAKQITPVGPCGEKIIDFSMYDAYKAGFEKIVFIIRKSFEKDFREEVGDPVSKFMEVDYVFQEIDPEYAEKGRTKPFGTAEAIALCREHVDGPFAVINADDYYGVNAFTKIYEFLKNIDENSNHYAMVGYRIKNTVTEQGTVSRGVCESDENGMLTSIVERNKIGIENGNIYYLEGDEKYDLDPDTLVSMNLWALTPAYLRECRDRFPKFLRESVPVNPEKCEFLLPTVVSDLLKEGAADVKVLDNTDKWYGVTYKEDKETVVKAFRELKEAGVYPEGF
jgi:hypothetical protein